LLTQFAFSLPAPLFTDCVISDESKNILHWKGFQEGIPDPHHHAHPFVIADQVPSNRSFDPEEPVKSRTSWSPYRSWRRTILALGGFPRFPI
jgi:hypothetical protein